MAPSAPRGGDRVLPLTPPTCGVETRIRQSPCTFGPLGERLPRQGMRGALRRAGLGARAACLRRGSLGSECAGGMPAPREPGKRMRGRHACAARPTLRRPRRAACLRRRHATVQDGPAAAAVGAAAAPAAAAGLRAPLVPVMRRAGAGSDAPAAPPATRDSRGGGPLVGRKPVRACQRPIRPVGPADPVSGCAARRPRRGAASKGGHKPPPRGPAPGPAILVVFYCTGTPLVSIPWHCTASRHAFSVMVYPL